VGGPAGQCAAGEVCVDPDAAGKNTPMCMIGGGTDGNPYKVQDYFWKLHLYDLELAASWAWNAFSFADRLLFVTHESSNESAF
jgi:hypothetical protein